MSPQIGKRLFSSVTGEQQDCCGPLHTVIPIGILATSAMHLWKHLKAFSCHHHIFTTNAHTSFYHFSHKRQICKQTGNCICNFSLSFFFFLIFNLFFCDVSPALVHCELSNAVTTARGKTIADRKRTNSLFWVLLVRLLFWK